ncbi:MAG: AN1-type zinc finger protein [bacterium]
MASLSEIIKEKIDSVYQVDLPAEGEGANRNESLKVFLSLHNDERMSITLAEPNLPQQDCHKIITRFIQTIYKGVMNEELPEESVELVKVGEFKATSCQLCNASIFIGFSAYYCPICGKNYCFKHRHTDKHHCSQDRDKSKPIEINDKNTVSKHIKPTVRVIQSLCG